jgi:hypothetical protein
VRRTTDSNSQSAVSTLYFRVAHEPAAATDTRHARTADDAAQVGGRVLVGAIGFDGLRADAGSLGTITSCGH